MNEVVARVRKKYPQYADLSDRDLTKAIADKYPQYLDGSFPKFEKQVGFIRKQDEAAQRGDVGTLEFMDHPDDPPPEYAGGVREQSGLGLSEGLARIGEQANTILAEGAGLFRKRGYRKSPGQPMEFYSQPTQMEQQLRGAAEVAGKAADEVNDLRQRTGGPQFVGDLAQGGTSIIPSMAVAPAGLPAMAVMAGAQSYGAALREAEKHYVSEGFSPDQAREVARPGAFAQGLVTSLVTAGFGKTGVEAVTNAAKQGVLRERIREVALQAGFEGIEESVDQLLQAGIQKGTWRSDLDLTTALYEAAHAGTIGTAVGGAANIPRLIADVPVEERTEADLALLRADARLRELKQKIESKPEDMGTATHDEEGNLIKITFDPEKPTNESATKHQEPSTKNEEPRTPDPNVVDRPQETKVARPTEAPVNEEPRTKNEERVEGGEPVADPGSGTFPMPESVLKELDKVEPEQTPEPVSDLREGDKETRGQGEGVTMPDQVRLPPIKLPKAGVNSADVAKQYGLPDDFYTNSLYLTQRFLDADNRVDALHRGRVRGVSLQQAQDERSAAWAEVVEGAKGGETAFEAVLANKSYAEYINALDQAFVAGEVGEGFYRAQRQRYQLDQWPSQKPGDKVWDAFAQRPGEVIARVPSARSGFFGVKVKRDTGEEGVVSVDMAIPLEQWVKHRQSNNKSVPESVLRELDKVPVAEDAKSSESDPPAKAIAQRIVNAEDRFMAAVREQFGKTQEEAEQILGVFQSEKIIKIDPVMGQYTLKHGRFWDAQVMDNALELVAGEAKSSEPSPSKTVSAKKKAKPAPPVTSTPDEFNPQGFKKGNSVVIEPTGRTKKARRGKFHGADSTGITVYLPKTKEYITVPPDAVTWPRSVVTRRQNESELAQLPEKERKQARADAREFDRLIREELPAITDIYNPEVELDQSGAGQKAQSNELRKARLWVMRQVGHAIPEHATLLDRARALPALKEMVAKGMLKHEQETNWLDATEAGEMAVTAGDLQVGDKLDVEGTPLEVVKVENEFVTLENGQRFGTQVVEDETVLYVEAVYQPEDAGDADFIPDEDPPRPEGDFSLEFHDDDSLQAVKDQEVHQAEQKRLQDELQRRQSQPLTGNTGDLGQGDLLQQPDDLFAPPTPKKLEVPKVGRSRPKKEIHFAKPIVGPSGAKLLSYVWQYQMEEYVDSRGEDQVRRVSDWDKAITSDETGRDIVHQFQVLKPDGSMQEVSIESAIVLLGFTTKTQKKYVGSLATTAKTLARLRLQESILQEQSEAWQKAKAEVDGLPPAEIIGPKELIGKHGPNKGKVWTHEWEMGDGWVHQRDPGPLQRFNDLVDSYRSAELRNRGFRPTNAAASELRDVQKRIKRAEERLAKASDKSPTPKKSDPADPFAVNQATLPRQIDDATARPETDQPLHPSDIVNFLKRSLDIPIRLGAAGRYPAFFKQKPEVIRTKVLNELPLMAHEVGHYLHKILLKGVDLAPFQTEINFMGAPGHGNSSANASSTPEYITGEGIAEFVRMYLTDPAQAQAEAPKFTKFFVEHVSRHHPEAFNVIDQAADMVKRYVNQTAAASLLGMINWKPKPKRRSLKEWFQKLYDDFWNELAPLERAEKRLLEFGLDPATAKAASQYAVNYLGGWVGKAEYSLFKRQMDFAGADVGPGLRDILSKVEDLQEFAAFLVGRRVLEKELQGRKTGYNRNQAIELAAWLKDHQAKYAKAEKALRQFMKNELIMARDAGFLSTEEVRKIEKANEFYVPFQRDKESMGTKGRGKGFADAPKPIRRFLGDDSKIFNPLESIIKNVYHLRDAAERNRVAVAFTEAISKTEGGGRVADTVAKKISPIEVTEEELQQWLDDMGLTDIEGVEEALDGRELSLKLWRLNRQQKDPSAGIFQVWQGGKQQRWQTDDVELYRALQLADSTDAAFVSRLPIKPLLWLTRALRSGATLTTEFMARNAFGRDPITAAVYSNHGYVPFVDTTKGLFHALGETDKYWDFVKSGARYADFVAVDRQDLRAKLEEVADKETAAQLVAKWGNPIATLQKMSEKLELASRIAEFQRAKAKGLSDVEAANAAKDVTLNFSRAGFKGKLVNRVIPFYNAMLQDMDKFLRMHDPRNPKQAAKTALKGFLYVTMPSLLTWWLGHDDEEIQQLADFRKAYFWNVRVGDSIFSFPKPFLLGQMYGTSVERALDYLHDKDPNAVKKWFKDTLKMVNPIPLVNPDLLPAGAKPVVEARGNYSFFRDAPLESQGDQSLPKQFRFNTSSSETSKLLSRLSAGAFGDEDATLSPIVLDNTVRGTLGGIGKYGTDALDFVLAKTGLVDIPPQPAKGWKEQPGIRAFFQSPYAPAADVERFYNASGRVERMLSTLRDLETIQDPGAGKYWKDNGKRLVYYLVNDKANLRQMQETRAALSTVRKSMIIVRQSRDMTGEQKATRLRELARQRDQLAKIGLHLLHPTDRTKVR